MPKRKRKQKITKRRKQRRRTGEKPCGGQCGSPGCEKIYEYDFLLKAHIDAMKGVRHACTVPGCDKSYSYPGDLRGHVRKKHPEVAPPKRSRIRVPERFKNLEEEYKFVKKMVDTNNRRDRDKNHRWTPDEVAYNNEINTNEQKHRLTVEIMDFLVSHNAFSKPYIDFAGFFIPGGLVFRTHGGLFMFSLDRKKNYKPHYLRGQHALYNLNYIPMWLNVQSNPCNIHGENLVRVLRQKQKEVVSTERIQAGIAYEMKTKRNKIKMALYQCCHGIYKRDKLCRAQFSSRKAFHKWAWERLKSIQCHCEISDIFLLGGEARKTDDAMYMMSIDAIDPRLGHVKGNMRIVCQFLNSTNRDKDKTYQDDEDHKYPTSMTREIFNECLLGLH